MKLSFPEKIVIGACVLGISAVTFRAVRLLAVGLACIGTKVYKGKRVLSQIDRHRRQARHRGHANDLQKPYETMLESGKNA